MRKVYHVYHLSDQKKTRSRGFPCTLLSLELRMDGWMEIGPKPFRVCDKVHTVRISAARRGAIIISPWNETCFVLVD